MPPTERGYTTILNELGDVIRVYWTQDGKNVLGFAVQYEAMIEDALRPVVRFDTAHDFAHRDILGWSGKTRHWNAMPHRETYAEAMNDAIADIEANWERYRSDFLRRRP